MHKDPYSSLAAFYDQIMGEIDYEYWGDYLDGIIQEYHSNATQLFEWACGTASLALSLNELDCYEIHASDLSKEMIVLANQKKEDAFNPEKLHFFQQDMRESLPPSYHKYADVGLCVFDSLNYLLGEEDVQAFFKQAASCIKKDGFLLFDFVTAAHCHENALDFAYEEAFYEGKRILRKATFPLKGYLHQTKFELYDGQDSDSISLEEVHLQRPYSLNQIKSLISASGFEFIAAFGDFTDQAPKKNAKRITLLAQCLTT